MYWGRNGLQYDNQENINNYRHKAYGIYEKLIKRPLDCLIALLITVLISPLLVILAVTVRIKHGNPVLFTQPRPGKNERIFEGIRILTKLLNSDKRKL